MACIKNEDEEGIVCQLLQRGSPKTSLLLHVNLNYLTSDTLKTSSLTGLKQLLNMISAAEWFVFLTMKDKSCFQCYMMLKNTSKRRK